VSSFPSPQACKRQLGRVVRFGPRKQAGLAAVAVALAIVGFVTREVLAVVIAASGLLAILILSTLSVELMRWRATQRRRTDEALRKLGVEKSRADEALRKLGVEKSRADEALRKLGVEKSRADEASRNLSAAHSQLKAAQLEGKDDRAWRDVRARVSQAGTRQRPRLFVFPWLRVNSYFRLIYQEFPKWDFDVTPVQQVSDLDAAKDGDVIHYHWTQNVQSGCTTAAEARAASDAVLHRFRTLQRRGVTIVWGVHEAVPHECSYPDVELEFRQSLANLADVVQVLHPSTNAALEGAFKIPEDKILVVPHPLYTGAQADHVTRGAARADLGYRNSDLVVLGIGAIRPYKGFERVVRLMPSLQERFGNRRLMFVIAGTAQKHPDARRYIAALETEIAMLPDTTAVRFAPRTVPDSYLHVLLRSADVSVAPYRAGLNSGVLMMNMTFGLPTVIASNPVTEDISRFGPVSTFPVDDDNALRDALIDRLASTAVPTVDPQFIQKHSPAVISAAFAQALSAKIRRTEAEDASFQVVAGHAEI